MKVLMTIKWNEAFPPSLEQVAEKLKVAPSDLDAAYGVINIDPEEHLYSVLVEEDKLPGTGNEPGIEGPFSNPRIEPFDLS